MEIKPLNDSISVSPQLRVADIAKIAADGFKAIICNRPDDEEQGQPASRAISEEAHKHGLGFAYVPAVSGAITASDGEAMARALASLPLPVLAYCRSGARSAKLYEMAMTKADRPAETRVYDVAIVSGGSAGIFDRESTRRSEAKGMPDQVTWIQAFASGFAPEENTVNVIAALAGKEPVADYDGDGSCPLTVEAGKIVRAEFGYGGKLLPSFPNWLIDDTRPSRLAWLLKDTILPPVYWHGMLKGREWMVKPHMIGA